MTKNTLVGTKVKYVGRKMMRRHAGPLIKGFQYQNIMLLYHFRQYIKVNTYELNNPLKMFPAHTDKFYWPFYPNSFKNGMSFFSMDIPNRIF